MQPFFIQGKMRDGQEEPEARGSPPDANGESGIILVGESRTEELYEYDSPRGNESTVNAGGRAMVMLRVTAAAAAPAAGAEEA
jgi:hypothetical protein